MNVSTETQLIRVRVNKSLVFEELVSVVLWCVWTSKELLEVLLSAHLYCILYSVSKYRLEDMLEHTPSCGGTVV